MKYDLGFILGVFVFCFTLPALVLYLNYKRIVKKIGKTQYAILCIKHAASHLKVGHMAVLDNKKCTICREGLYAKKRN